MTVLYLIIGLLITIGVFYAGYFIATFLYRNSPRFRRWLDFFLSGKDADL
jgi:predicted permease